MRLIPRYYRHIATMSQTDRKLIYAIVQSAIHPNCKAIYDQLGVEYHEFNTIRKAQMNIKKRPPDILVAEFLYGYANNYSGVHISNLDVMLETLNKYTDKTKLLVFVTKQEKHYMEKLPQDVYPITKTFVLPLDKQEFHGTLQNIILT